MKVHLFIGNFNSKEEAVFYTEPTWEPEPDDSASDEEYSEWKNNNPKFKMQQELGCYSDFIETITENKFNYLKNLITDNDRIKDLEIELNKKSSTLILFFEKAIFDLKQPLKSTDKMKYHGTYLTVIK